MLGESCAFSCFYTYHVYFGREAFKGLVLLKVTPEILCYPSSQTTVKLATALGVAPSKSLVSRQQKMAELMRHSFFLVIYLFF